jgi:hypothetical protein
MNIDHAFYLKSKHRSNTKHSKQKNLKNRSLQEANDKEDEKFRIKSNRIQIQVKLN